MKKLSVLASVVLAGILAVSASAAMFTDVDSYSSFEMKGDPCYVMDDYADVGDYYAGAWDSAGDNGDELTTAIVDGAGFGGSKAIGVSSSGVSNAGLYLYATDSNGIAKGYDGQTYLRVWCDFSEVAFRKGNFGVVTIEDDTATIFTADEGNAEGGEGYQTFYYSADGVNWTEMCHGSDGCFGDAQDSDIYGLKGFFAFPLDSFYVRSNCNWNAYDAGTTPIAADIVGVYLFWDYSDNYVDSQGNTFYLDNIEFVADYKTFDYDVSGAAAETATETAAAATENEYEVLVSLFDGNTTDDWYDNSYGAYLSVENIDGTPTLVHDYLSSSVSLKKEFTAELGKYALSDLYIVADIYFEGEFDTASGNMKIKNSDSIVGGSDSNQYQFDIWDLDLKEGFNHYELCLADAVNSDGNDYTICDWFCLWMNNNSTDVMLGFSRLDICVKTGEKAVETAAEEVVEEVVEETVVEEAPVEEVVEETVEEVVEEAPAEEVAEEVVEEAAAVEEVTESAQTFDFGVIAAIAAIVSAAGYAVSKKH